MGASEHGHSEVVGVLLEAKASPEATDRAKWMLLVYICREQSLEVVQMFPE